MFWNSKSLLINNFLIYHKLRYWYWSSLLLAVLSFFFMIQHCFFNKNISLLYSIGYLQISERNKHYLVVSWIWVCAAGIAFPLNACILILKNSNQWLIHPSSITQGCLVKLYATIVIWIVPGDPIPDEFEVLGWIQEDTVSPAVFQTSGLK